MAARLEGIHGIWTLIPMKRYINLFLQYANYETKYELEFRLITISYFLFSFVWVFTTYIVINLIYGQAGTIAGWTREEALLLVLVYYVTSTLIKNYVTPSLVEFIDRIRLGDLDFLLIKPVDPQFLIVVQRMQVFTSTRAIIIFGLLIFYLAKLHIALSLMQIFVTSLLAVAGLIGLYSFFFMIATLGIWLENVWNLEELFSDSLDISKQPMQIYPQAIRTVLLYALPLIGISAVPTAFMLHKLDAVTVVSFGVAMIALFIISRLFFRYSLSHYSSASS
jgi:ABC-2 type transport system permease protein